MRELKFRVWDTQLYVMYSEEKDIELGDGYEPLWKLECRRGGKISYPLGIIMQYTGMKDGNGKEIYEGDIVKQYFPAPWDDKNQIAIYGQITFGDPFPGCFCFVNHKMDNTCCLYEIGDEDGGYGVVVGDIYENPELLKI